MLLLFINLYMAMFTGTWSPYETLNNAFNDNASNFSRIGTFLTSIFGDANYTDLGEIVLQEGLIKLISLVLALITSIGIVVMAVKGIKRVFSIFFMGIR